MKRNKVKKFTSKNLRYENMTVEEMENFAESDIENADIYREAVRKCKEYPKDILWNSVWKLTMKSTEEQVGIIWIYSQPENNEVRCGIFVNPEQRQKGIASEAVKIFNEWMYTQKENFIFIIYSIDENNPAQLGFATKMQFKKVRSENGKTVYETERANTSWTGIFMCLGLSLGLSFGLIADNMSVGMCIGMAIGVAIGLIFDSDNKKKKEQAKQDRYDYLKNIT